MLNATFEMFILHYVMKYVDNLCSICSLHEQSSSKFIIFDFPRLLHVCLMALVLKESILLVTLVPFAGT